MIPNKVLAHNPAGMTLEYDFSAQKLNVTITHNVADTNTHYIEKVEIWKNDVLEITRDYTSQPSTSSFTYSYDISAVDGDVLKVKGTCSISGSITREITVVEPVVPSISVSVEPQIISLDENATQVFTITLTSASQPVDGATLTIFAQEGSISNQNALTGGKYEFKYTAPAVAIDTGETINITASKANHNNGYLEFQFTILDIAEPIPTKQNLTLVIIPNITYVDENDIIEFTITVTSDSQPVSGVNLVINTDQGEISDQSNPSEGEYKFVYTAPTVDQDTTATITILVSKEGYNSATEQFQLTIFNQTVPIGKKQTLDGQVAEDEYEFTAEFDGGNYKVHWRVVDEEEEIIFLAIEAKTSGWVAIGFEPKNRMEDADMLFGWVDGSGEVIVVDAYSTGETGPHPPDNELGGTNDILEYGGSESSGWTIIEFKRLLDTDDEFDNKLKEKGDIDIIWAVGNADDFQTKHSKVGSGTIDLATGESTEDITLWPFHAALMITGFILMVIASIIVYLKNKVKWWFKAHKTLNILGVIFAVLGLVMGIYMVAEADADHFRVPHAFVGGFTLFLILLTPTIGFLIFKAKNNISRVKTIHRWLGRFTNVMMLVTIIFGLIQAGVL
jgi:hypothetical protein